MFRVAREGGGGGGAGGKNAQKLTFISQNYVHPTYAFVRQLRTSHLRR